MKLRTRVNMKVIKGNKDELVEHQRQLLLDAVLLDDREARKELLELDERLSKSAALTVIDNPGTKASEGTV
jgi:hypothetical protein